jgi:hypothetical protein
MTGGQKQRCLIPSQSSAQIDHWKLQLVEPQLRHVAQGRARCSVKRREMLQCCRISNDPDRQWSGGKE